MELPVPTAVPPQLPENHSATAPVPTVPPLKVRVVDPPLQIVVVPVILVGATDDELTVTVTGTLVAEEQLDKLYVIVTDPLPAFTPEAFT